jgi:hypothetical protein
MLLVMTKPRHHAPAYHRHSLRVQCLAVAMQGHSVGWLAPAAQAEAHLGWQITQARLHNTSNRTNHPLNACALPVLHTPTAHAICVHCRCIHTALSGSPMPMLLTFT